MWRGVGPVRIDVSKERVAFIFWVKTTREVGTTLAVTSNCSTLRGNADNNTVEGDMTQKQ
jgi:hypothetical protein